MADIRCAMCGKSNPAERETCKYCNARLKPLTPPANPAPSSSGGEDVPDWLSSLRDDSPQEITQSSTFDGEGDTPDWLSRLGGSSTPAQTEPTELPDWFSNLEAPSQEPVTQSGPPASPQTEPEETKLPDWFSSSDTTNSVQDWLSKTDEQEQPAAPAVSDASAPDWMSGLQSESSLSGWLSESEEQASSGSAAPTETGETDWMSGIQSDSSLPGWLSDGIDQPSESNFGLDQLNSDSLEQQPAAAENQPDSSEWLSAEQVGQNIDDWFAKAQDSTQSTSTAPANGLPDWLSSLNETTAPQAGSTASEPFEVDDGSPDWLDRVRARRQADQERIDQASPPAPVNPFVLSDSTEDDLSFNWLTNSASQPDQELLDGSVFSSQTTVESQPDDDSPDWLRNLSRDVEQTSASSAPLVTNRLPELFDDETEPTPPSAMGDTPDWLAEITDGPGTPLPDGPVPAFIFDSDQADITEEQPQYDQSAPDTSFDATPDWLSSVTVEDSSTSQQPGESETSQQLEPADLPTWLEAMRPVDAVTLEPIEDSSDGRIENVGPLAGLRGALPADIHTQGVRPPVPYTIKLPVTEDLESRLNTLKSLLETEDKPKLASARLLSTNVVLRLAAFVVLLAIVILALYIGPQSENAPLQAPLSAGAQSFQDQLKTISAGSHVLLALDYEPGYAAEINLTLGPVLAHLHDQGVMITAVSSSVSGALLIEQADSSLPGASDFQLGSGQIQNLGYLPGGPAGLMAFALNPAGITPADVTDKTSWADAGMNPAAGLDNFSVVLVATNDAKTVSMWAEQLGPVLLEKRIGLLMISSTQSAAVIQPYYATTPRLISGYLSSLRDAQYAVLAGQQSEASGEMLSILANAYSAALLAAFILIVAGGALNLLAGPLLAKKQTKTRSPHGEVKA